MNDHAEDVLLEALKAIRKLRNHIAESGSLRMDGTAGQVVVDPQIETKIARLLSGYCWHCDGPKGCHCQNDE